MGPLGNILRSLGIGFHFYADDTQIYVTFDISQAESAVKTVEEVVWIIKRWMSDNFLRLNDDKTEVILIASKNNHAKLDIASIQIGENEIKLAKQAKNIGFIFDSLMDSKAQILQICKIGWFQLRNIGRIRPYLDRKSTEILVHAFITSRIDLNNCLLLGLPQNLIQKLQLLQNAAARLIMKIRKHDHITPTLQDLHWLPVLQRIDYKTILIVFKALHDLAPGYIKDMLTVKHNTRHSLRSNGSNVLVVPKSGSVRYGDRNLKNIAPKLWNELPSNLRDCDNINCFKTMLKSHLFRKVYCD